MHLKIQPEKLLLFRINDTLYLWKYTSKRLYYRFSKDPQYDNIWKHCPYAPSFQHKIESLDLNTFIADFPDYKIIYLTFDQEEIKVIENNLEELIYENRS